MGIPLPRGIGSVKISRETKLFQVRLALHMQKATWTQVRLPPQTSRSSFCPWPPSSPSSLHSSLGGQSWVELQRPGRLFRIAALGCVRQRERLPPIDRRVTCRENACVTPSFPVPELCQRPPRGCWALLSRYLSTVSEDGENAAMTVQGGHDSISGGKLKINHPL